MADANLLYAEAAERQQAAELDQARIDLARTVIAAPIDGVVIGRDVDRGQTVAASLEAPTLFTIAQDLRQMEVHAKIDEADIGQIRVGQQASFTVDAYPGRTFSGHRRRRSARRPQVVENVVTYTVVLSTRNADLALLPGMTAIVQIVVEEVEDVLKVPNAALRFQPASSAGGAAAACTPAQAPCRRAAAPPWSGSWATTTRRFRFGSPSAGAMRARRRSSTARLRAGQQVIVGTARPPQDHSWFGFSWRP